MSGDTGPYSQANIRIYVDSMAALEALDKYKVTSRLVSNTKAVLNLAGRTAATLELNWIKAHVGYPGNELADETAKQAAGRGADEPVEGIPVSTAVVRRVILGRLRQEWTALWADYKGARMTKQFYPGPDEKKAKTLLRLSRGS